MRQEAPALPTGINIGLSGLGIAQESIDIKQEGLFVFGRQAVDVIEPPEHVGVFERAGLSCLAEEVAHRCAKDGSQLLRTVHRGCHLAALVPSDDGRRSAEHLGELPTTLSARDYYPFGLTMPARDYIADENNTASSGVPKNSYRFGFNGKESDRGSQWGGETHYDSQRLGISGA